MRIPVIAVLLAAALPLARPAIAGSGPARQAAPAGGIAAKVAEAVRGSGLRADSVAVSVAEVATGKVVHDQRGDAAMVPASNMKVLTTGAALHVLGPAFEFRTRMVRGTDRLTVVGDGDPSLGDPAFLAEAEKSKLEVDPMTGEELAQFVAKLAATPPDVVKRVKDSMAGK